MQQQGTRHKVTIREETRRRDEKTGHRKGVKSEPPSVPRRARDYSRSLSRDEDKVDLFGYNDDEI